MYGSTLKLLVYVLLVVVALSIYQYNINQTTTRYFEPIFRTFHTDGASINKTLILAHRGSRYLLPENTMLAFNTALDIGADVIECDVRATSDDGLVVYHDKLLKRTTGLEGTIEERTLAQVLAIDAGAMFSPDNGTTTPYRGKGLRIPLARQLFDELPVTTSINIEIKEDDERVADLLWTEMRRAFEQTGRQHRTVVVGCRYCAPTLRIRQLAAQYQQEKGLTDLPLTTSACEKDVTRFVLLSQFYLAKIYYTWFPMDNFETFQIPPISGPISLDKRKIIDTAHFFGKHIHYWVINEDHNVERILGLGIEGIITDRPDVAVRVFKQQGYKPRSHVIPKPLPGNLTGTYYLPEVDIEEVHTCITPLCMVLQHIDMIVISLVLSFVVYKVLFGRGGRAATSSGKAVPSVSKVTKITKKTQ
ncbi:hypothetical protein SAMD00019534_005010 [Acytostelium subglobosum LB1]|uniref:hypothetical protein n=1 Tax=Acytostelium subglobosum LB1 TaxID=1410327 RepID=UPI000644F736|nr:hypothetical protein SAMD00019534_005010 [Acytostelium subglobosum LB1]GAM17326.1 hypothetical protein SAMD00019534_005010 [Acytostelium subglobosum LB1]|eukprot:XP_012759388.1 hypothetical protein SAMD00019534_005010 [Acytostelium subglobosum LB1]